METFSILIVICEWAAFSAWAVHYRQAWEQKYRLFPVYLGTLACTELANLLFWKSDNSLTNIIVNHFNVPLQFIFWYWFLIYEIKTKRRNIFWTFGFIYLSFYIAERCSVFVRPVNFDSFSYGIGILFLIAAIIMRIRVFFRWEQVISYQRTVIFWILIALILYYIGSFPYQNFRNYFWNVKKHYELAYLLHYISLALNCIMYLLFAFSARWKIR